MSSKRAVFALLALLFPVCCAALGYCIAMHMFPTVEWKKAVCILLGFFVSSGIVIAVSRNS